MTRTGPQTVDFEDAASRLRSASRILVTTHARADGDAVGSALAMARILRGLGKEAFACFHEAIPPRYIDLPDASIARVWPSNSPADVDSALQWADLIVIVDTCAAVQLEGVSASLNRASARKLAIDHHVTRDAIVDEILLDESAGACAEIIARLCEIARWPIDADTATLLFAGLATDTGWFRFSNADGPVFAAAAQLVAAGARPNLLYERLYLSEPEPRVRLMGAVMSTFELRANGRLAIIRVTRDMLQRCGATAQMTEEIINETHRVGSVIASAMFVEPVNQEEPVRISLRSKRDVHVAEIASRFGGGGHERAAGAKLREPFEEAVRRVTLELEKALGGIS